MGDQIKKNKMGKACSTYADRRGAYRVLVGKSEGKKILGRPGVDWSIILRWDVVVWTGLIWLRIGTGGGPL